MNEKKPIVIVLLGPTASGKTDLAIEIAKNIKTEIHNIDSRQIYKGMNIGTAKPSVKQQKQVKHHLLDLANPNEPITVHEFKTKAESSLYKGFRKEKVGFLVGGSGLYLKALTNGLCPPAVAPQKSLRKKLQKIGQFECHQMLQKCDPLAWEKISKNDAIRTIRALEVIYSTGEKISSLKFLKPPNWTIIELGLDPINLHTRIETRTKFLFENGLIEETKELMKLYGENIPLLQTIGYKEAITVIKEDFSITQAIEKTVQRTKQFAKKQRTWFRRQHNAKWLNEKNSLDEALSLIKNVIG